MPTDSKRTALLPPPSADPEAVSGISEQEWEVLDLATGEELWKAFRQWAVALDLGPNEYEAQLLAGKLPESLEARMTMEQELEGLGGVSKDQAAAFLGAMERAFAYMLDHPDLAAIVRTELESDDAGSAPEASARVSA